MIAVVLPAAIAAFTSGQVRSSMYTDCPPTECSVAAGVAANAATFRERAMAVNSKTHLIMVPPTRDAGSSNASRLFLAVFFKHYHPQEAIAALPVLNVRSGDCVVRAAVAVFGKANRREMP